jgi:NAD dependent epimerase/dehydratase family enzyme
MVKLLFGEMGMEVLCGNVGVLPQRLLERDFKWEYPDIGACLDACLAKRF